MVLRKQHLVLDEAHGNPAAVRAQPDVPAHRHLVVSAPWDPECAPAPEGPGVEAPPGGGTGRQREGGATAVGQDASQAWN